jgi:hypothetical protein
VPPVFSVGKEEYGMFARIFKYADLSWKDLTNVKRWFQRAQARHGFTFENFNPSMRLAKAENSIGQTITLTPIEICYVVGAYICNPDATSVEIRQAGDSIDVEVMRMAQREGVQRVLVALPDSHATEAGEFWIRVVERNVSKPVVAGGASRTQATTTQFN